MGFENQHINQGAPLFVPAYCAPVAPTIGASEPPYSRPGNERVETEALAVMAFQQNQLGELRTGSVAGTLNTNSNPSGRNTPMICQMSENKNLTLATGNDQVLFEPMAIHPHCIGRSEKAGPNGKEWRDDGKAFTLDTVAPSAVLTSHLAVRRLTPTECERLQGFPDGWTNIPWRGKDHAPDGPRYKALGNSMSVPCMRWLGERIQKCHKKKRGA